MHGALRQFLLWFLRLGALGPLLLGIGDSSFLFLPFGNDLLVTILVARDPSRLPIYILAASVGWACGVLLTDMAGRKGGEQGLKRLMSAKQLGYLKKKIKQRATIALIVASLAPPPFPFTLVVAASSALQYPRARLLGLILIFRAVRFLFVGLAAIRFGRQILEIVKSAGFEWFMNAFIALCLIGTAFQTIRWIRRPNQP